jgi:hypothetical protein
MKESMGTGRRQGKKHTVRIGERGTGNWKRKMRNRKKNRGRGIELVRGRLWMVTLIPKKLPLHSVVDTGGKFVTGVIDTGGKLSTGLTTTPVVNVNLREDVTTGVNNANGQLATGVVDTGMVHLDLRTSPRIFEKIQNTRDFGGKGFRKNLSKNIMIRSL